jgi:hypothetical protein
MKRTFGVELDVVVEEPNAALAIQLARDQYHLAGHASEPICDGSDDLRDIPPEEFIPDIVSAITELAGAHPLFQKAGIEITDIACREIGAADAALSQ